MRFLRAAQIDAEFYLLPLTMIEREVYFYLSSRCQTRWGVSEATMVSVVRSDIKRIRAALEVLEDMHLIKRWRFPRPKCHEYLITLTTSEKWGIGSKRTLLIGSKRTPSIGANAPYNGVQTHLSPITIEFQTDSSFDTALLELALPLVRKWHFAHKAIGDRGVIGHKHQRTILQIMKALVGQGLHLEAELVDTLLSIRDYLATPKDTLSDDGRDYREKTLGRWLTHWTDQLHRAQSFMEMRKRNIVQFEGNDGA